MIINDILDFSKIESGKFEIVEQEYYLGSLLTDVATVASLKAQQKNLEFHVSIDENTPAVLIGDETRIRQILTNLVSNALKYTREGGVKLHVNSSNSECDATITITVSDSGIGIKPGDIPKLFKEYSRLDATKNIGIKGVGLGLTITRRICQAMGGDISVTSVYGQGSTFTVNVPQKFNKFEKLTDLNAHRERKAKESTREFTAPTAKILIADDLPVNLKVAEVLMSGYQMHIDTCGNGREAVNLVMKNQYDIVFLDHMMPDMDGVTAANKIRSLKDDYYKNLPIIALTANAIAGVEKMFKQNGMSGFLPKPIDTAKLNKILSKWIPQHKKEFFLEKGNNETHDEANAFVEALRESPVIAVGDALDILDGSSVSYERIAKLTFSLLSENITKLDRLIEHDITLYAVEVHGIKGALRGIGANSAAKVAQILEDAAKAANTEDCRKLHISFKKECYDVIDALTPLIVKAAKDNKPGGERERVCQAIPVLAQAAEAFDRTAALQLLEALGQYTYGAEIDEMLSEINCAFELYEYKGITSKINTMNELLTQTLDMGGGVRL